MANQTAKKNEPKSGGVPRDSVGWGFWLLTFAVLFGPAWYLGYRSVYESDRALVPWIIAVTLAAIGAGLLSMTVNRTLRSRAESARKQARHDKKKQAAKK